MLSKLQLLSTMVCFPTPEAGSSLTIWRSKQMEAGANPLEITRVVDHSNAEMLWKVYGHATENESFNGADMRGIMTKKAKRIHK